MLEHYSLKLIFDKLYEIINPNKYGLECMHKERCKHCKTINELDVKPLLQQSLFPSI